MVIVSIDPARTNKLFFDIDITGSSETPSDIRFIIADYYICEGIFANNKLEIKIPPISHIFETGTYNCYLEIILENRVFVPFNEQIKLSFSVQNENKEIKRKKKNDEDHYIFEGFKNPFRKH